MLPGARCPHPRVERGREARLGGGVALLALPPNPTPTSTRENQTLSSQQGREGGRAAPWLSQPCPRPGAPRAYVPLQIPWRRERIGTLLADRWWRRTAASSVVFSPLRPETAEGAVGPRRRGAPDPAGTRAQAGARPFHRAQPFIPLSLEFFPGALCSRTPTSQAPGRTQQVGIWKVPSSLLQQALGERRFLLRRSKVASLFEALLCGDARWQAGLEWKPHPWREPVCVPLCRGYTCSLLLD